MHTSTSSYNWRRPFWISLLIVSSFVFSFAFACATPFAALAAAAALTLPRRDAFTLIFGVWAVNQFTGYVFLHYPTDANSFAWGAALLVIALTSLFSANLAARSAHHFNSISRSMLVFLVAFIAYEAMCYAFSLALGGNENFALDIQSRIFVINIGALAGLFAINYIGSSLKLIPEYSGLKAARS